MNTHSINSLFSILVDAVGDTDNEVACLVIAAQEKFRAHALASLPELNPEEKDYTVTLTTREHILAIKSYRDRTGCTLYEAKNKVDNYRREFNAWSHA